jgi:hypothetical protein
VVDVIDVSEVIMVSSRTALFSALALCASVAAAQGLSSGSTSGSVSQGTLRPGQPALQAPTTPSTTATPQAATPTPSASTPLPGQSTMPQQLPPLNSTGVGGQAAIAAPPGNVPTRSSTAAEAFSMLDRGGVGYITRADTDRIPGFMGFDNADTNRDGQLSKEEFSNMWRAYSGQ